MWKKSLIVVALFAVSGVVFAAEESKGPKCPVSGKKVNPKCTTDYKGGKVCFCCGNCLKAFKKDSSKFAAKANHQLVVTGQAKQTKCPFSGGKMKDGTEVKVKGVAVKFCCKKCKGKAESSEDKIAAVFNDKSFGKGFEVKKKK